VHVTSFYAVYIAKSIHMLERHGAVVSTRGSYLVGPGFKSRVPTFSTLCNGMQFHED
jgi:hypothetical protein